MCHLIIIMARRMQEASKMLKNFNKTARVILIGLFMAVFFSQISYPTNSLELNGIETGFNDLVHELSNSIVTIEATKAVSYSNMFGSGEEVISSHIFSGIIYDTLGHIITTAKAVADMDHFLVHFDEYKIVAEKIGVDYQTGLALLKVDKRFGVPVQLSRQYLCSGQVIIALGNSYGVRASPILGFCAGMRPEGTVQFAGMVTAGSIGGGMFNLSGDFIGVLDGTLDETDAREVGIGIPSFMIPFSVEYMIRYGDREAGYLGLTTNEIEISPGIRINIPRAGITNVSSGNTYIDHGLMVVDVAVGSPAEKVGLKNGDLLFQFNKRAINSAIELKKTIMKSKPGTDIELGFVRKNIAYFVTTKISNYTVNTSAKKYNNFQNREFNQNVHDSLILEINFLKKSLYRIEQKLNQLH